MQITNRSRFSLIIITLFVIIGSVNAADVGGSISVNTTWAVADSPFKLTSSVLVEEGVTLTIEAGSIINIASSGIGFQVNGTLVAKGTPEQKIVFQPATETTPGSWGAIGFGDPSTDATFDADGNYTGGSILQHCVFKYAGGVGTSGQIAILNASPLIDSCQIQYGASSGIYVDGAESLKIRNCLIHDNIVSEGSQTRVGGGITVKNGTVRITDNIIEANVTRGLRTAGGIFISEGTVDIIGNTISNNSFSSSLNAGTDLVGVGGIYLESSNSGGNVDVISNRITGNSASVDGGPIAGGIGIVSASGDIDDNTISDNTIGGNPFDTDNSSAGIFVYGVYGGGPFSITGNVITGNIAQEGRKTTGISNYGGSNVSLENNLITGNTATGDGDSRTLFLQRSDSTITGNTIGDNNTTYDLAVNFGSGETLTAENNYWQTVDPTLIPLRIYDFFDNSSKGVVDFKPFLSEAEAAVPPSAPSGLSVTGTTQNSISVSWPPNTESDIAGYRLYWQNDAAALTEVELGQVTNHTLSDLVPGRYTIWVAAVDSSQQVGPRSDSVFQMLAGTIASLEILTDYTALQVGDQIPLAAAGTDTIGNRVLMTSDQIAWGVSGIIGTVSAEGVFTATTAGEGGVEVYLTADNAIGDSRNLSVFSGPTPIEVGGTLSSDTRWTAVNSPVTVSQSLTVSQGLTLSIEPGVEVRFNSGYGLTVEGQLIARGTVQRPIAFISAAGRTPGSWGSISFNDSSQDAMLDESGNYLSGSILQHCLIESGAQGSNGQVIIDSSAPLIEQCTIVNGGTRGIFVKDSQGLTIRQSTISGNGNMGLDISNSRVELTDCLISKNTNGGLNASDSALTVIGCRVNDNLSGRGLSLTRVSGTLSDNTVSGNATSNSGAGLYVYGSEGKLTLRGNTISDNHANGNGNGGGLYFQNVYTETLLIQNTITGNSSDQYGGGLYINHSDLVLRGNTISRNQGVGIYSDYTRKLVVEGNTLSENVANSYGGNNTAAFYLSNVTTDDMERSFEQNLVSGNQGQRAIFVNSLGMSFEHNTIRDNQTDYDLYFNMGNANTLDFEHNDWGTTDPTLIPLRIYDFFDDPEKGVVDFDPYLDGPDPAVPPSAPSGLSVTGTTQNSISVSWPPNTESDIAGYRLYWQNDAAALTEVELGDVSNHTLSDLAPGRYSITVAARDANQKISAFSNTVEATLVGPIVVVNIVSDFTVALVEDVLAFVATGFDVANNSVQMTSSHVNWTVTGGIGAVSENGVFTATTAGTGIVQVALKFDDSIIASKSISVFAEPTPITAGGPIESDTRWTPANSPIRLTKSVVVNAGITLTIEPGVSIELDSGLGLLIDGELIARGSPDLPITFGPSSGTIAGSWANIGFSDSSADAVLDETGNYISGSILRNCVIKYGGGSGASGQLVISESAPLVDRCRVSHGESSGIYVDGAESLKIRNCLIHDNIVSEGSQTRVGGGITVKNGTVRITDNIIEANVTRSLWTAGGIFISGGTVDIIGNTISNNSFSFSNAGTDLVGVGGIYLSGGNVDVISNRITGNSASVDGGPIAGGIGIVSASGDIDDNTISDNTIGGNPFDTDNSSAGIFVYGVYGGGPFSITGNVITGNIAQEGRKTTGISNYGGSNVSLENNLITGNTATGDGDSRTLFLQRSDSTITGNTIGDNNTTYDLAVNFGSGETLTAENNYWQTADQSQILGRIYDFFDNSSKGKVDFEPFLTEPNVSVPPMAPTGLAGTATTKINLTWNANIESDIVGYLVYYGTGQDSSYDGEGASEGNSPINVGHVTSYELSGLTSGLTYYIAVAAKDVGDDQNASTEDDRVGALSNQVSILLTASDIASIAVSPPTASVDIGQAKTFVVTAADADAEPVAVTPSEVNWSVTGEIGTIDGGGVFTAIKEGTGRIQAKLKTNTSVAAITDIITVPLPPPAIVDLSPTHGLVGDTITINGSHFGAVQKDSAITFNNIDTGLVVSWSDNQIEVNVPAGSSTGKLIVTVDGRWSNEVDFILDSVVNNITNIKVTNLTSNSATVTFVTDGNAVAGVNYGMTVSLEQNEAEVKAGVEAVAEAKAVEAVAEVKAVEAVAEAKAVEAVAEAKAAEAKPEVKPVAGGDTGKVEQPLTKPVPEKPLTKLEVKPEAKPVEAARQLHSVEISGLNADTTYYFNISAGGLTADNDGNHFQFHTTRVGSGNPYTLFGRVLELDNTTSANGVIVYVEVLSNGDRSYLLSSVTDQNGYWFVNLGNLKNPETLGVFSYAASDSIVIDVQGGVDGIGNDYSQSLSTSPQNAGTIVLSSTIEQSISLVAGLNLLTLPLEPDVADTAYSLISKVMSAKEIVRWKPGTQSWEQAFDVGEGTIIGTDFDINLGQGYMIHTGVAATWNVTGEPISSAKPISLVTGLNLIGIPHPSNLNAMGVLPSITNGQIITQWNAATQSWSSVFDIGDGTILGDDFSISNSNGYFIQISADTTWTPTFVPTAPQVVKPSIARLVVTDISEITDLTLGNTTSAATTIVFRTDGIGRSWINLLDQKATGKAATEVKTFAYSHMHTLSDLRPNTVYTAQVEVVGADDKVVKSETFQFATGGTGAGRPKTVFGQVLNVRGSPKANELIALRIDGAQKLVAKSDANGYWNVDLGNLKTADGNPMEYKSGYQLSVSVIGDGNLQHHTLDGSMIQNLGLIRFNQDISGQTTTIFRPKRTDLGQNYPNPFNPETWIPFQLGRDSEVKLEIYAVNGLLIRRIELGLRSAGYYTTRDSSIYWDGKNNLGESVASGIYFYVLITEEALRTERMIVIR